MPEPVPSPSEPQSPPTIAQAVQRRRLLRGGALIAGAAGAAVVGATVNAPQAAAIDGAPTLLGEANDSSSATTVTIGGTTGSATDPTLALANVSGPSLALDPVGPDFSGELAVGQIANTAAGPFIGVDYGDGPETTYLATALDLQLQPQTVAITPERLVDTRYPARRSRIIRSSVVPSTAPAGCAPGPTWMSPWTPPKPTSRWRRRSSTFSARAR